MSLSSTEPSSVQVAFISIDPPKKYQISFYYCLYFFEVEWISNNVKDFSRCYIGPTYDYSKKRLGALKQNLVMSCWFSFWPLRFLFGKICYFPIALPLKVRTIIEKYMGD